LSQRWAMPAPTRRSDNALRPALEHLVKGIVEHPDDVRVRMVDGRRGQRLEVRVHPDDLGTVIGRGGGGGTAAGPGHTTASRRAVVGAYGSTSSTRTDVTALLVGRIIRPHGVRGEVVVAIHTDSPEERFAVGSVLDTDPPGAGPLRISEVRQHQHRMLVLFDG